MECREEELKKIKQKPAEWSEKDEKMKEPEVKVFIPKFRVGDVIIKSSKEAWVKPCRITSISEHGYNFDNTDDCGGGFIGFSFEDEYELKRHAGWSEEDEHMFKRFVDLIPQCMTAHGYNEMFNWLKSLRPNHWRPTKIQMEVLKKAADVATSVYDGILLSLYNDLLKL